MRSRTTTTGALPGQSFAGGPGDAFVVKLSVTVVDTTPPMITAPPDKTAECNTEGGATGVSLGTPNVSDIVDPNPTVTNNAPATLPLGLITVEWTGTDASGNSAMATQKVTVVDTTAPSVTAALVPVNNEDHNDDESLFMVDISASDICDPNPVLTAEINGIPVVDGQIMKLELDDEDEMEVENEDGILTIEASSFTLTATATDASGNTATATAIPTFADEEDE